MAMNSGFRIKLLFFIKFVIFVLNPFAFSEYVMLFSSFVKIGINAIAMLMMIAMFWVLIFSKFSGVSKLCMVSAISNVLKSLVKI